MTTFPLQSHKRITSDTLSDFYNRAASASTGGMYPVGANGLWHGGIHLSFGQESDLSIGGKSIKKPLIHAPTGGRIVAARLDPDPEQATCAFGHTNFILTKHTWTPAASEEDGTPFYMLFMHLAPVSLEGVAQEAGAMPWLTGTPLLRVTASRGLRVRSSHDTESTHKGSVPTDALMKPLGEPIDGTSSDGASNDETSGDATRYRWQEVEVLRQNLEGFVALGELDDKGTLKTPWTKEAPPPGGTDIVGKLESGEVAKLDVPIEAGEMLWWMGQYGKELEWDARFESLMDDAIANTREYMDDAIAYWTGERMNEGFEHPSPIERAPTVHWEVFSGEKVLGAEQNGQETSGQSAQQEDAESGDSSTDDSNNETGGTSLQMPSWTTQTASSDKRTMAPSESDALSLIEKKRSESSIPDPPPYRSCELREKQTIYTLEAGKPLRRYAVKNVSEWGIQDLDRAIEKSPSRQKSEKEDLKAMRWWKAAKEAGVKLPDSPKVWHYHPVTALKAIGSQTPQFFVNIGGEQKEVTTYEDVRDLIFDHHGVPQEISDIEELYKNDDQDDVPSYTTVVEGDLDGTDVTVKRPGSTSSEDFASVEAGYIKDKHGNITGWKAGIYDFASDTPDLYEMLIKEKKMRPDEPKKGVPDLSDFDANVWASISESEACLKGINTWDRAHVTIGPIQQTLGVGGAKGELQGALHTARLSAPEAYKRQLGRYGLQPQDGSEGDAQGAKKAHATLHGEPLTSSAKKERLQQFAWVDRLAEAFGDPALRYWMLREGFNRLEEIRNRSMTLEVPVEGQDEPTEINTTIGEIFRRDLSQALLLDWHVNSPADVWSQSTGDNYWLLPVQDKFGTWEITSASDLSVSKNRERQLVAELLQARMGNMTNPARRAGKILKYAGPDRVADIAKSDGYNLSGYETQNALIEDFLQKRMNAKAVEAWSNFTPDQTVLTFEKHDDTSSEN